jgi:hypothetical protein
MKLYSHLWFLAIALLLASIIWSLTMLLRIQESTIDFPVLYTNLPSHLTSAPLPSKVKFVLRGKGFNIVKAGLSNNSALYDASTITDKEFTPKATNFKLDLPASYNITNLGPVELNMSGRNSNVVSKQVKLELSFANDSTREKFYRLGFSLLPNVVALRGLDNEIDLINGARTETITSELLDRQRPILKLITPSEHITVIPDFVELIALNKESITRVISSLPVDSDSGLDFFPRNITIRIAGNASIVNSLQKTDIRIYLAPEKEKQGQIPVEISLPKGVQLLDYSPEYVIRERAHDGN